LLDESPQEKKCLAWNCSEQAVFGELCADCRAFVMGDDGGERSQAFRNAMGAAGTLLRERSTHLNASRILSDYHKGKLTWWKRPEGYEKIHPPETE
jgi:hypothetical protein